MATYLKDPAAIERKSFSLIREAADLRGFSELEQQIVMRLAHTCGDPDIAGLARFSSGAAAAGLAALRRGCPVLCDVEMVRHGLTRALTEVCPAARPRCFLNHPGVAEQARRERVSRTMSAVAHWAPHLTGSIAVIGNAPTALFRLLELLEQPGPKPALVIGMPVLSLIHI